MAELAADYHTTTGEQSDLQLNPQLRIQLNTQTSLNRLMMPDGAVGVELLKGEAEFQFAASALTGAFPALQLRVAERQLLAKSARFNVRYTDNEVCVTCVDGDLALRHPRGRFPIGRGQQLTYGRDRVALAHQANLEQALAWRQGWLEFHATPLAQAIDEINRYRPGKLILRTARIGTRQIYGRFAIAQLEDMPDIISDNYGVRISRLPGGIVLLG